MVKLLIDGMPVNLPADLSIEFYDRNPLFSKEGRHTLDIDINLSDPQNAYIYENMYRIDVLKRPSGRAAVLYSEHGVIIRGTEVILNVDNKIAKIQLVAGNSELNYLSGGDCHIRDLDLGEIKGLNKSKAWNSCSGSYPTWDYVCPPICVQAEFYNGKNVPMVTEDSIFMNEVQRTSDTTIEMVNDTMLCPQPYLAAIVRKIIEALGYTIESNFIESKEDLKKIILVNGYCSTIFNEMIPNWKVNDFISEVEKFTGCIFVVNQITKTVSIIQTSSFYTNAGTEEINQKEVIGELEKKYDEKVPEGILYHNVKYKLPSSEIYNYWSIEKDLMNSLTIQQCENQGLNVPRSRFFNFQIDIWAALNGGTVPEHNCGQNVPESVTEEYNKMIAYDDLGMGFNSFFVLRTAETYFSHLRRINYYGPRYDEKSEDSMELKIVPAELVWRGPDFNWGDQMWQQPFLLARNSNATKAISTEDEKGLNDYILGGASEDQSGTLFAAYYLGFKDNNYSLDRQYEILSPTAVPSNEVERFYVSTPFMHGWGYWEHMEIVRFGEPNCCMAINAENGMYNKYWKNNLRVDFTSPYTIKFKNNKKRDPRNIFVVSNKKFYCQQIKYNINGDKISDIAEGIFYPVKTDKDESYTGKDIAIAIQIDKSNGYVRLYSDKLLDWPITVQLSGVNGSNTYSALIDMAAGVSQKSTNISWVMEGTNFAAAIYNHDTDDANTYSFTISVKNPQ